MSVLAITVGIPGSGKSTWAEIIGVFALGRPETMIVNPDKIREELTGNASDQSQNHKVFERAHWLTEKYLVQGDNVIFDATNLTASARKPLMDIARRFFALPLAVRFDVDTEVCRARNLARERVVPVDAMDKMIWQFMLHCKTEILFDEGWAVMREGSNE